MEERDTEGGREGAKKGGQGEFVDGSCFIYTCAVSYLAAGQ